MRHGTCFPRRLSAPHAGAAPHSAVAELEVVRRRYAHPVNRTKSATQTGKRHAVRTVFWLHALTAAYCVAIAVLDGARLLPAWLSPNILAFYALLLSVGLFPLAAALFLRGSGHSHPGAVEFTHVFMSFAQLIGLLQGCA